MQLILFIIIWSAVSSGECVISLIILIIVCSPEMMKKMPEKKNNMVWCSEHNAIINIM